MKKSNNRKCICCGKTYSYCPKCGKGTSPWMFNFDTEVCKEVFNVVSGYNMGVTKGDAVRKVIEKNNIKDFSKFNEDIAKVLKKVTEDRFTAQTIVKEDKVVETITDNSYMVQSTPNPTTNNINRNNINNNDKRRPRFTNNGNS